VNFAGPEFFQLDLAEHRIVGERWRVQQTASQRPEVVLLHGGGQTRHSWKRTASRLNGQGWTATALDARGHGDSEWHPGGDYSLDGFVFDLLAYTGTLERPPVLVGASLGGMTALVAAGEHPGSVSAIVLVDIVIEAEPRGVERIRDFMTAHGNGFASLEEVSAAIAAYNPHRPRPPSLDGLRKNVHQHDDGRFYWHWDPAFIATSSDEPQRRIGRERLRAAAHNIKVPTLLVRGLQSEVVSDAGLADMVSRIPQAEVSEVGAAGHMIAGDDNDMFAGRLAEFLAGLPA
jgi:pimeloyl-ACP methyl ester carboxylesterase